LGLSIVCLSGPNEKIKFIFDLFDLDNDDHLSKTEFKILLETSVMSFRKLLKGPQGHKEGDAQWIDHHLKLVFSPEKKDRMSF
jgi:hypothetical protein